MRAGRGGTPVRKHIFQFTPLREGRQRARAVAGVQADFNSRPCGRGDAWSVRYRHAAPISIHAPAGGATCRKNTNTKENTFQFTPLREGRRRRKRKVAYYKIFQFTPLREGRPMRAGRGGTARLFQFTPLREGRPTPEPTPQVIVIHFNSRPCGRGDFNNMVISV